MFKKRTLAIIGIAACGVAAALVYFFRNYELVYEEEAFKVPIEKPLTDEELWEIELSAEYDYHLEELADQADVLLDEFDQIQEELADQADALSDEYDRIQQAKKQKAKEIADKKKATRAKNTAARQ